MINSTSGPEAAWLPRPGHARQADHEGGDDGVGGQAAAVHRHVEAAAAGDAAQEPHLPGRHQGKCNV